MNYIDPDYGNDTPTPSKLPPPPKPSNKYE